MDLLSILREPIDENSFGFHNVVKKGLAISLLTILFGILILGVLVAIAVTTGLGEGATRDALVSWFTAKIITISSVFILIPIAKLIQLLERYINRKTNYAWALSDPLLSLFLVSLSFTVLMESSKLMDTLQMDGVGAVDVLMEVGVFITISGMGTASAMSFLLAITIMYSFVLKSRECLSYIYLVAKMNLRNVFKYPILFVKYAEDNNYTLVGAGVNLIYKAHLEVKSELRNG